MGDMDRAQCIDPDAEADLTSRMPAAAPDATAAGGTCNADGTYSDPGPTNSSSVPLDAGQANSVDPNASVPPGLAPPNGLDMGDVKGIVLNGLGCAPGPLGTVATGLGMYDTAATADPKASPGYRAWTDTQLALVAASLAGVSAAGPVSLVGSVGYAAGKGAQVLGDEMNTGQREADANRARAGSTTGELPPPYINNGPTGDPLNDNF